MKDNTVEVRGVVSGAPAFSHLTRGIRFFKFTLESVRLSGAVDELPVITPETLSIPPAGRAVTVRGQLRSFNNQSGTGARLMISLLARDIRLACGAARGSLYAIAPGEADTAAPMQCDAENPAEYDNRVALTGSLCKEPVLRCTPFGRSICDLLLCVPRSFGRADYLPCIAWGQTARQLSQLKRGDLVCVEGRFQSRRYTKKYENGCEEVKTAFEVSIAAANPIPMEHCV